MAKIVLIVLVLTISQVALGQRNIPGVNTQNSLTSSIKAGLAGLDAGIDGLKKGMGGIRSGVEGIKSGVNGLGSGMKSGLSGAASGSLKSSSPNRFNSGFDSRFDKVNSGGRSGGNSVASGRNVKPANSGVVAANKVGNTNFGLSGESTPGKIGALMQVYSVSPIVPYGVKAKVESCACDKKTNLSNGFRPPKNNAFAKVF